MRERKRKVICMAAFIAWGPLKYKEILNYLEVQLISFRMESGMHAYAWIARKLQLFAAHSFILVRPSAERI